MQTTSENANTILECGYRLCDMYLLPSDAWFANYYDPLEQRIDRLEAANRGDRERIAFLEAERKEISLFRRLSSDYGYVFYTMENA